jgi:proteasome alpha subunit
MPFYVAPEQLMRDKADYARRWIAEGRPLVATLYTGGILLVAENKSRMQRKIGEIYDHIAFGGVGKASEFDQLRQAGVRWADVTGYNYSREDVNARSLANVYAQAMGDVFTRDIKPYEVEILVAELGDSAENDQLYRISFNGVWSDEDRFTVLGGEPDAIKTRMEESYAEGWALPAALTGSVAALAGPDRALTAAELEVAVLERGLSRRAFRRIEDAEIATLLAQTGK